MYNNNYSHIYSVPPSPMSQPGQLPHLAHVSSAASTNTFGSSSHDFPSSSFPSVLTSTPSDFEDQKYKELMLRVLKKIAGLGVKQVTVFRKFSDDIEEQDYIRDANLCLVQDLKGDKAEVISMRNSEQLKYEELCKLVANSKEKILRCDDTVAQINAFCTIIEKGQ